MPGRSSESWPLCIFGGCRVEAADDKMMMAVRGLNLVLGLVEAGWWLWMAGIVRRITEVVEGWRLTNESQHCSVPPSRGLKDLGKVMNLVGDVKGEVAVMIDTAGERD